MSRVLSVTKGKGSSSNNRSGITRETSVKTYGEFVKYSKLNHYGLSYWTLGTLVRLCVMSYTMRRLWVAGSLTVRGRVEKES